MFVDKALKLLNLKQVAFEIENSVLSKVSCSACKAGECQQIIETSHVKNLLYSIEEINENIWMKYFINETRLHVFISIKPEFR